MNGVLKKAISMLLCLMMVFSIMPSSVFAEEAGVKTEEIVSSEQENISSGPEMQPDAAPVINETKATQKFVGHYTEILNNGLLAKIGKQSTSTCSYFCIAYARAVIDGHLFAADPGYYDINGWADWGKAGFSDPVGYANLGIYKRAILNELKAGYPVIIHLTGGQYANEHGYGVKENHYVCVVGYNTALDENNIKFSDFYAIDPSREYGNYQITLRNNLQTDRQLITCRTAAKPGRTIDRLTVVNFGYPEKLNGSFVASGMIFSTGTIKSVDYYVTDSNGNRKTEDITTNIKTNLNTNVFCITSYFDSNCSFIGLTSRMSSGAYYLCLDVTDSTGQVLKVRKQFYKGSKTIRTYVDEYAAPTNALTVSGLNYPTYKNSGANQPFNTFGTISTPNGSVITYVEYGVNDLSGINLFKSVRSSVNAQSFDINSMTGDMEFMKLRTPDTTYYIYLKADNNKGQHINWQKTFLVNTHYTDADYLNASTPYVISASVSDVLATGFKVNINAKDDNSDLRTVKIYINNSLYKTVSASGASYSTPIPVSVSGAGQYTVKYQVIDSNNCYAEGTLTANVPETITLSQTAQTIEVGKSFTIKATCNAPYSWSSSNETVATVSNGVVKAVGAGTAVITARTSGGKTATCSVTVTAPVVPITSVALNKHILYLATGCDQALTASIAPANASASGTLTWTSSNENVATVTNGVVKGVGAGSATITVKTANGEQDTCEDTCEVKVYNTIVSDGVWMPGNVKKGEGWGVGGYIYSASNITDASIKIFSQSGEELSGYTATPNSKVWSVWDAASSLNFKGLDLGTYKITLQAFNANNQWIDYTHDFTVSDQAATHMNYFGAAPYLTDFTIKDIDQNGFTVRVAGADTDAKLGQICILVWSGGAGWEYRDDMKQHAVTVSDSSNAAEWRINISDHNYDSGPYWVDCIVFDEDGNRAWRGTPLEVPETAPASVTLSEKTKTLSVNDTFSLTATVAPAHAANNTVTWSSSNTSVATVSSTGVVTAVGNGSAVITAATQNGKSDTCSITVSTPITHVVINKSILEMRTGESATLAATVLPENTSGNRTVTWSSSNTSVATVSNTGVVTAVGNGSAVITATASNNKSASCEVFVSNPAESLRLSEEQVNPLVGGTAAIRATVTPSGSTDNVTWYSSDESVATVDQNGTVNALKAGHAIITARTDNALTAECTVKVYNNVESITSEWSSLELYVGQSRSLDYTITPSGAQEALTWISSNESVVSVSDGTVHAGAEGVAIVSAVASNGVSTQWIIDVRTPLEQSYESYGALTLYGFEYPEKIRQGENPAVSGSIRSSESGTITYVSVKVTDQSQATLFASEFTDPGTYDFDLQTAMSGIDFAGLAAGNYTLAVYATNSSGNTIDFDRTFTVGSDPTKTVKVTSTAPIITKAYPADVNASGYMVYVSAIDTDEDLDRTVYETYTEADGKDDLVRFTEDCIYGHSTNYNPTILAEEHGGQTGRYITEVTVVDDEGNSSTVTVTAAVPGTSGEPAGLVLDPRVVTITGRSYTESSIAALNNKPFRRLRVEVYGTDVADSSVTWESSDPETVSVYSMGPNEQVVSLIGLKPGSATVTATTSNGLSETCQVFVDESIYDIYFPANWGLGYVDMKYGETKDIFCNKDPLDIYDPAGVMTWTSSDPSIVSVEDHTDPSWDESTGCARVTANGIGKAVITGVSSNGNSGSFIVYVTRTVTSVDLEVNKLIMNVGDEESLLANVQYEDEANAAGSLSTQHAGAKNNGGYDELIWITSDSDAASVEDGLVTALGRRNVLITVMAPNGISDVCSVIINDPIRAVSLNETELELTSGSTYTLSAEITPLDTSDDTALSWDSSDTGVAAVSSEGVITAVGTGTCEVTVTTSNGISAVCAVSVTTPIESVTLSDNEVDLNVGSSYSLNAAVLPANADGSHALEWTSSDEEVISLENGQITALHAGTCTVTVTAANGKSAACTVHVYDPLVNVVVPYDSLRLPLNDTYELEYELVPAETSDDRTVTFASSAPEVVSVDSDGTLTAHALGSATITVTASNGMTAQCEVEVYLPVTDIVLSDQSVDLLLSQTHTLTASIVPENATQDPELRFVSSDTSIATVNASGLITAVGNGTCEVTVTTVNGKSAVCTVNVTNPITSLAFAENTVALNVGDSYALDLEILPLNNSDEQALVWDVSDDTVLMLEDRQITALKAGSCVVTVTAPNGLSDQCTVTVSNPITMISVPNSSVEIPLNGSLQFEYELLPEDTSDDRTVSFVSSDPSIVSVDGNGMMTGNAVGTANVTVTASNGMTAECAVTVIIPITEVALSEEEMVIPLFVSGHLTATVLPDDTTEPKDLIWYSNNEVIATVNEYGNVYGSSEGTAQIYVATPYGTQASCTVTVEKQIALSENSITLMAGETFDLDAEVSLPDAAVEWICLDEEFASVDQNGVVTALAPGYTLIEARLANGTYDLCNVLVTGQESTLSLTLDRSDLTVVGGKTAQLTATVTGDDPSAHQVVFVSADPGIATVDATGKLKGIKAGTTTVKAYIEGYEEEIFAVCNVRVLFKDVTKSSDFFFDAVYWALENGITTGTSNTTFEPNNACTRGQIVTFLYRAAGEPEVNTENAPKFKDVKKSMYYYKAVLWAASEGITTGYTDSSGKPTGKFGPDDPCTRGQIVTFMWRAAGSPKLTPTSSTTFKDVKKKDYFYYPVIWAATNKITTGVYDKNGVLLGFKPNDECTRGMVVTFLYRAQ